MSQEVMPAGQEQDHKRIHNFEELRPFEEKRTKPEDMSLEELIETADSIESLPEYIHYAEAALSPARMESLLEDFDAAAEGLDAATIAPVREVLSNAINAVKSDVRNIMKLY